MSEIEKIIPEIDDYLDYSKVLKLLNNEFSLLIKKLDKNEDRYFNYDFQIVEKLKSRKKVFNEEVKTLQKESDGIIRIEKQINKFTDYKTVKKLLAETEIIYEKLEKAEINTTQMIKEYENLINALEPIWKSIKYDKKVISKALWKSHFLQAWLLFVPFLLIIIVLAFSFLNDSLSSFLFSFNHLNTILIFSVFSIGFFLITNKLTNYFYYKRLKNICISNAKKVYELRQSTDVLDERVENNYQIFYDKITKANIL